jgi:cell wall-associated NlpC family hydrolase
MKELMIAHARSMLKTKWRHLGRSKTGVDCLGLVILSLKAAGYKIKYERKYGREPWNDGLREALKDHFGEPITGFENFKVGDIALLKWEQNSEPAHVGIIADYKFGGLSLIHSYSLVAVTEHRIDNKWKQAIVEVYRPWQ